MPSIVLWEKKRGRRKSGFSTCKARERASQKAKREVLEVRKR